RSEQKARQHPLVQRREDRRGHRESVARYVADVLSCDRQRRTELVHQYRPSIPLRRALASRTRNTTIARAPKTTARPASAPIVGTRSSGVAPSSSTSRIAATMYVGGSAAAL